MKSEIIAAVAAVSGGLLCSNQANAANYVWNALTAGSGTGSWSTSTNWTPALPGGVSLAADTLDFSTLNITADSTVSLDTAEAASVLTFGDTDTTTPAGWILNATNSTPNDATHTLSFVPGTPTINVQALAAGKSATINATLSNGSVAATTWGLAKGGAGTLTLTANNKSLTGIVFINNGMLSLDFNHAWSPASNIIGDTSSGSTSASHLEFQGGTLNLIGNPTTAGGNSQTFSGNSNMGIGAAEVTFTQNGASSLSLGLGALTHGATSGGSLDVNLPTVGTVTATSAVSTGGLIVDATNSPYVTVNNGADWAAVGGTNLVAGSSLAGFYTPNTSGLSGNADIVANSVLSAATSVASIRHNDAAGAHTIDLGATNILTTGGILMTPTAGGALTIQNGTLNSTNGNDATLMISQNTTNFPLNISAAITNNPGGTTELIKNGAGTLVLSGNNTYNGSTYINGGTLSVTGGTLGAQGAPFPAIQIAPAFGNTATMNISGAGTIVSDDRFLVAGNAGNFAGGTGTVNMSGGTVNSGAWFSVGLEGAGTLNQTGGTINVIGGFAHFEVAVFGGSSAVVNMSGTSALNLQNGSGIGFGTAGTTGNGTLNQNGGTVTFYSDGGTTVGGSGNVNLGASGTGTYTYNFNGGTLNAPSITHSSGTGIFNFNGGTLRATGNSTFFVSNLTTANVQAGGAIIDTNGFSVTVPQVLSHAAALGATVDGGLTKAGAGTMILSGAATYTGPTKVTGGTLQLPSNAVVPPPTPIASYSFDTINGAAPTIGTELSPGDVVNNGGSGGAALNGTVNNVQYTGINTTGINVVAGKFGNGVSFDGGGSSIDVNSNITDMSGNAIWTVSMWAQTTTKGSSFFSKVTPTTAAGSTQFDVGASVFYLGNNGNNPGTNPNAPGDYPTAVRNSGGWTQGGTAVDDGQWHLVTFVDNGGTKSVYVDGNLSSLTQPGFTTTDSSTGVRIGFTPDPFPDGNINYTGAMDELQFYNAALTQTQVQDLFANNTVTHSTPGGGGQLLPTTSAVNLSVSGTTLNLNGNNQTVGSLAGVTGSSVSLGAGNLNAGGDNTSTTFAGAISSTGGGLIKAGTGTMTLTGTNTYTGNTSVTLGTLVIGSTGALPVGTNLNIGTGANVNVVNHGTGPKILLQVASLSTTGTGTLDLSNNDAIIKNGDPATVFAQLKAGFNAAAHGYWNGNGGIASSAAASDTRFLTTIGNRPGGITFDGVSTASTDILVKYTYYGDADLNGIVNGADYQQIDAGFGSGATGWSKGDFNYDGVINGSDFALIDNTFNQITATGAGPLAVVSDSSLNASPAAITAVPEPATLGLLGMAAFGMLSRRRRNA